MEKTVIIKQASIANFLNSFLLNSLPIKDSYGLPSFQKVITLLNTAPVKVGDTLVFESLDQSSNSRKPLINRYTYLVKEYDSFSLECELMEELLMIPG